MQPRGSTCPDRRRASRLPAALLAVLAALLLGAAATGPAHAQTAARHQDRAPTPAHAAAGASTLPDEPQTTAEMPVRVPATPSCTETLTVHDFGWSYGAPATGAYSPPAACPGPWATVVLALTSTVGGVQFDRSLTVSVGDVVLLHGTTSEPCCTGQNAVTWTVQRDVTAESAVLAVPSHFAVQLDNIVDSTYTGVYHTTVTLTYYEPGPGVPAATTPSVVIPVTSGNPANEEYSIGANGQTVGRTVTFPRNLVRLSAELFANGQGPCEEFWWSAPNGTSCLAGTPYREVAVYLDGRLAGAAPIYPTVFTGGDGPGLWEPIPSPRTWNLRPYTVDLGPFVGTLTDGLPHAVTIGVLDSAIGSGDFWPVAATLLGDIDAREPVAAGALTSAAPPAAPVDDTSASTPATYADTATHDLVFSGWVTTSTGTLTDTVTERSTATDTQDAVAGATTDTSWTWTAESVVTRAAALPGGASTTTDILTTATSSIVSSALTHFSFTDNGRTTTSVDGVPASWSEFDHSMDTSDATGLAVNGVEDDTYRYGDSLGACYSRTVLAAGGQATSADRPDCPGAQPAASVAEAPAGPLLVGSGALVLGALPVTARRRRRGRRG